jgi:hypothetical protein
MHNVKAFLQGKAHSHVPAYISQYVPAFVPSSPETTHSYEVKSDLQKFILSSDRYVLPGTADVLKNVATIADKSTESECIRGLKGVALRMADEIKSLCSEFLVGNELAAAFNNIMHQYDDCPSYT